MPEPDAWLRAGTVGRPHGLDGSFHVGSVVSSVFTLLETGGEVRIGAELRRIERLAGHAGRPIVRVEGCVDRDDAEALRGQELTVARALAPALEDDEWWASDLEGCVVRDGEREVGVVSALLGLPSCDVLEVRQVGSGAAGAGATAAPLLVPLVRDAVRSVDIERRVIDVDLRFLGAE